MPKHFIINGKFSFRVTELHCVACTPPRTVAAIRKLPGATAQSASLGGARIRRASAGAPFKAPTPTRPAASKKTTLASTSNTFLIHTNRFLIMKPFPDKKIILFFTFNRHFLVLLGVCALCLREV